MRNNAKRRTIRTLNKEKERRKTIIIAKDSKISKINN